MIDAAVGEAEVKSQTKSFGFFLLPEGSKARGFAVWAASVLPCLPVVFDSHLRDVVPEPIDFYAHAGNIPNSAVIGFMAGVLSRHIVAKRTYETEEDASAGKAIARSIMAASGLVVGLVANALVETKVGISISHWQNTPDNLDLAYGTTAAVIAAVVGPELSTLPVAARPYIEPF